MLSTAFLAHLTIFSTFEEEVWKVKELGSVISSSKRVKREDLWWRVVLFEVSFLCRRSG